MQGWFSDDETCKSDAEPGEKEIAHYVREFAEKGVVGKQEVGRKNTPQITRFEGLMII